ncbi:hypothetical protein N0V82_000819 [Gnomoniopsis sp. IMI 355080]|nr:hypothetical protein N0V82_000819 [Gnomoniopsis sp. IMI 355080]
MSTDSIETLRRKFLRQNRDIARVNSAQSLRIRSLESECGRLLSDNLTLNGRILELEKALEEAQGAQRIADHALELKDKMEAQLAQWGALIQGLGIEPAAKRRATSSPSGRRISRPRRSEGASPVMRRRPRDSRSAEAAAAQEDGRLPPIHENKTYPRRTMSHAELVAICTEAEEINGSPDLGPPPTSRFVEDDPVKIDSPSRSTGVLEPSPKIKGELLPLPDALQQPKLEPKKKPAPATTVSTAEDPKPARTLDGPARQILKAGSKRKFGDENTDSQVNRALANKDNADDKFTSENQPVVKDLQNSRIGRDSAPTKIGPGLGHGATRPRKPLGEKSTNDDLVSPKKSAKSATSMHAKKTSAEPDRALAPLKKKRVVPIKLAIPSNPPPSSIKSPEEPETPSADPGQVFSNTPETRSAQENTKDTPPPTDISVHGETSRPSRRARPAISYAEPSLRDKMRRPTKELFDAVTGEGKFVRSSSAHLLGPLSSTKTKTESENSGASPTAQPQDAEAAMADEAARRPAAVSPLVQRDAPKNQPKADLPESVVAEQRRKPSSRQQDGIAVDPYEFQSTSPLHEQPKEPHIKGRITKGMRRSMAASAGQGGGAAETSKPSRKRSSMAAPNKMTLLESPMDEDSSFEASGDSTKGTSSLKDKISRRRSMML